MVLAIVLCIKCIYLNSPAGTTQANVHWIVHFDNKTFTKDIPSQVNLKILQWMSSQADVSPTDLTL